MLRAMRYSAHYTNLENACPSDFRTGDYLVSNNEDGTDAYCMSAKKFESMY